MKQLFGYILLGIFVVVGSVLLVSEVDASEKTVISFLSNAKGNYDIFLIDTDGEVLDRLVTDDLKKAALTCAPDRYQFAYSSNALGDPEIYKMDIRNKLAVQLTDNFERDIRPAWSPNGKWIAFASDRDGPLNIYRMDTDGNNLVRLTDKGNNLSLAWSPDSQSIAFGSEWGETHFVNVMNADGGLVKELPVELQLWSGVGWSPDGQKIAYTAGDFIQDSVNIYTVDINTKIVEKITHTEQGTRVGNPAWSPDGKWITYSVIKIIEEPNPQNNFRITFGDSTLYLLNTDTGKTKALRETKGLSLDHVSVWTTLDFFSVSPASDKRIVTWGKLKQP